MTEPQIPQIDTTALQNGPMWIGTPRTGKVAGPAEVLADLMHRHPDLRARICDSKAADLTEENEK